MTDNIAISIGWDCGPATYGVQHQLRKCKSEGYMTCPFDLMITNYNGIIEFFKDDCKHFTNLDYIELKTVNRDCQYLAFKKGDRVIVNTKYNFIFNHESPNHGNLYLHENWPNGTEHYCMNNFKEFVERYNKRIENLKKYLNSTHKINFIIAKINNSLDTCNEFELILKQKYPELNFSITCLEESRHDIFNECMKFDFFE